MPRTVSTEDIEEEGTELTSEELEAIVEDLGKASQSLERGEGEGEEQRVEKREEEDEGKVTAQPWEPKAQWEDNNVRVGERERAGERKKVKIWSFLEEKTRVSNEERAQASSKHTPQQAPVFRSGKNVGIAKKIKCVLKWFSQEATASKGSPKACEEEEC